MITPNFDLMLWIIFIVYILKAGFSITEGILGREKDKYYNVIDIIAGVISLVLMAWVAFS